MSQTFKTWRPDIYAACHHKRDEYGVRVLPRIIHRKPHVGDVHPLKPELLRHCLRAVPTAYIYGLRAVELRPRQGEIGSPYGLYSRREKRIWLYSCPPKSWLFSKEAWPRHEGVLSRGAHLAASQEDEASVLVEWSDPEDLAMLYVSVLFHELGHHYVNQYSSSRGRPKTRGKNELVADLHGAKIEKDIKRRIPKRESRRQADQ